METRYFDSNGRIDYHAVRAQAVQLRAEAIDAFWAELSALVAGYVHDAMALARHEPKRQPVRIASR